MPSRRISPVLIAGGAAAAIGAAYLLSQRPYVPPGNGPPPPPWEPPPGSLVITDFGASPDARAVDNQAAIQRTYDAVPALGSVVAIPPGIYKTGPVVVTKPKTWTLGAGNMSMFKADPALYVPNNSVGGSTIRTAGGLTEVVFSDFALDGAGTDTCFGITVRDGTDAVVQRILAQDFLGVQTQRARGLNVQRNGPSASGPFRSTSFIDCTLVRCQTGIVTHWCNALISGCVAADSPMDGFYIDGLEGRTTIENSVASRCLRAGFNLIVAWSNVLRGNRAEQCATGIQVYNSQDNLVEGNTVVDGAASEGISVRAISIRNTVRRNIVLRQRGAGEGIFVYQAGTRDNVIEENDCSLGLRNGILSNGAGPNTFRRNVCFNNGKGVGIYGGVTFRDSSGNVIGGAAGDGNRCYDDQPTKTQAYGVITAGTSDFNKITFNDLRGNRDGPLQLAGSGNTVSDNILS